MCCNLSRVERLNPRRRNWINRRVNILSRRSRSNQTLRRNKLRNVTSTTTRGRCGWNKYKYTLASPDHNSRCFEARARMARPFESTRDAADKSASRRARNVLLLLCFGTECNAECAFSLAWSSHVKYGFIVRKHVSGESTQCIWRTTNRKIQRRENARALVAQKKSEQLPVSSESESNRISNPLSRMRMAYIIKEFVRGRQKDAGLSAGEMCLCTTICGEHRVHVFSAACESIYTSGQNYRFSATDIIYNKICNGGHLSNRYGNLTSQFFA